jgi:galactokinase
MSLCQTDADIKFIQVYNEKPSAVFRAPGRVNLLGEHTDYNNGFVMPVAVDRQIMLSAKPSERLEIFSLNMNSSFSCDLNCPTLDPGWGKYIYGVWKILKEHGFNPSGLKGVICSTIPIGSGLSSSAALEIVIALALRSFYNLAINDNELALVCQEAENKVAGVQCGIMDQFASLLSIEGHILFLDCSNLSYEHVPYPGKENLVVVCDTGVRHNLGLSEYNRRRSECNQACVELSRLLHKKISSLREVSVQEFNSVSAGMDNVLQKRARHIISENARVLMARSLLEKGDINQFAALLFDSHLSLKNDYQVSCPELDALVELAKKHGALGAKMTGAGFGGCTVSIVPKKNAKFFRNVAEEYRSIFGIDPIIYECMPSAGALTCSS